MILNLRPKSLPGLALMLTMVFASACGDDAGSSAQQPGAAVADAEVGQGGRGGSSGDSSSGEELMTVTIRFRGAVADRDFSCLEEYEGIGSSSTPAVPADFRLYVQDLKLIDDAGREVPVELETRAPWQTGDVALLDFEDMTGQCHGTPETNTTITGKVPTGKYTGVVFTNGVPEELNHLEQSTQPPPLDVTDLYWAWLSGYRFLVAEMLQPTAADGADNDGGVALPGIGLLHIGSTSCRRNQGCKKKNRSTIRLERFDPNADVIVSDIAAIFTGSDVAADVQCHAADEICAPMFERLGVDFATGESTGAQKVFRVAKADR